MKPASIKRMHWQQHYEKLFEPMKRNLKHVSHQTPMAHAETALGRSFGLFRRQYPLPVSWIVQLFWLIQQHPAKAIQIIVAF